MIWRKFAPIAAIKVPKKNTRKRSHGLWRFKATAVEMSMVSTIAMV